MCNAWTKLPTLDHCITASFNGIFFGNMFLASAVLTSICGWITVAYKLVGVGNSRIFNGWLLFTKVKPPKIPGAILSACSLPLATASPFIAKAESSVLL